MHHAVIILGKENPCDDTDNDADGNGRNILYHAVNAGNSGGYTVFHRVHINADGLEVKILQQPGKGTRYTFREGFIKRVGQEFAEV